MKIQCDVCEKDEASVFCVADEASLCAACDHRVHHANKLAGKHQRFTLHHSSPNQSPLCDICQERKAFLFCQQDRAMLCRECDIPIHNANEHTKKHTRFLLTGVKLSVTSTLYSESYPSSAAESASSSLTNGASDAVSNANCTPSTAKGATVQSRQEEHCDISEYLIEMLPGWHVEDFLDSPSPSPYCFQSGENGLLPFLNDGVQSNISREKMGIWVPQAPPPLHYHHHQTAQNQSKSIDLDFGLPNGFRQQSEEFTMCSNNNNMKSSSSSTRKRSDDNSFAVPQISHQLPSTTVISKKSRTFW